MKTIIVAGGKGERLRPMTNSIPKPMVKVGGKPILEHIINLFIANGINEFILALCYLPEVIVDYFGDGSRLGVKINYTFEDPSKPLGDAGAINLSKDLIKDTFIVTFADILRRLDLRAMIKFHMENKALATLNVYRHFKDPKSMIIFDEKTKVIKKFVERPQSSEITGEFVWSNGSLFVLEPEVFEYIPDNTKIGFGKDIFPKLISQKNKLLAFPSEDYFLDIGAPKFLEEAERTFKP